jgi:release factor glutamine methyltransferase
VNHLIADNRISSVRNHLRAELKDLFTLRELEQTEAIIFRELCQLERFEWMGNPSILLSESQLIHLRKIIKRLKSGEPLQYVMGATIFCGLKFDLISKVLIPRPETEELVMLVRQQQQGKSIRISDAGCGSGCIAVSLAKFLPQAEITAVDIDTNALECTRHNARLHHVHVQILEMNIIDALPECDILVSNPPYISPQEAIEMSAQVLDYEPHLALFTPEEDSIIFYRKMLANLPASCRECYFEISEFAVPELQQWACELKIKSHQFLKDMQGKFRFLHIQI